MKLSVLDISVEVPLCDLLLQAHGLLACLVKARGARACEETAVYFETEARLTLEPLQPLKDRNV